MEKLKPESLEESWELVKDILIQGDHRYINLVEEKILSTFILNEAVSIEEREFPIMEETKTEEILDHYVQGAEKEIAKKLLKMKGFNEDEILFEQRFFGSVPDVLVERKDMKIIVECRSCRVSKIIEFLSKVDEIWILTAGTDPWDKKPLFDKMQWFIFKKGPNWEQFHHALKNRKLEELKKVKSPLDGL